MEDKQPLYDHIDQTVFAYQNGSSEAALELLVLFGYDPDIEQLSAFLKKYFTLLRYGVINFRDRDTRRFLRLYIKDPDVKEGLTRPYQYAETKKAARKMVQYLNDTFDYLEDEELLHDLCSIILELAKRYVKQGKKKNFCGYLYNSYRFYVYHHFQYLFNSSHSPADHSIEEEADPVSDISLDETWYLDLYFEHEQQELGLNWILGRTATFPFNQLSPFERTLLSLYDDKEMTYEEVGEQMGYHRDTIWQKRKHIKEKLETLLKDPPCD